MHQPSRAVSSSMFTRKNSVDTFFSPCSFFIEIGVFDESLDDLVIGQVHETDDRRPGECRIRMHGQIGVGRRWCSCACQANRPASGV